MGEHLYNLLRPSLKVYNKHILYYKPLTFFKGSNENHYMKKYSSAETDKSWNYKNKTLLEPLNRLYLFLIIVRM